MIAFLLAAALWPGFAPESIPLAVFDGQRTLLYDHPSPPEGFTKIGANVFAYEGRHPAVSGNSSIEIGGVETATVLAKKPTPGLIAHEKFHVFQRARHPKWGGNEVDLFLYPIADADALALQRLELEALRRALAAKDPRCWTRAAMDLRRERFAKIAPAAAAYERGTELKEGIATYLQFRIDGNPPLLKDGAPEEVRDRAYATGHALARLLDRIQPQWRESLERDDTRALDELLVVDALPCALEPEERATIIAKAHADARAVAASLADRKRDFLAQPGWTITIDALLFPERFDPLNVQVVDKGEVLHTRFLKLTGEAGSIEILGRGALTEAAGAHPLFNGVRRIVLTGFATEPRVADVQGVSTIDADGVKATLRGARVTVARAIIER